MKIATWVFLAVVASAVVGCALLLVGRDRGQPESKVPGEPRHGLIDVDPLLVGTASCSARGCHGGIEPMEGQRLSRNEYTTWVRTDKHAAAYRVLAGERAQRIMKNLAATAKPGLAHEDGRCLACHSVPGAAGKERLAGMRLDGVGCEACHGPARNWLAPHTAAADWARLPLAEKTELGMTPLNHVSAVARTCVGCHVGAAPDPAQGIPVRDVNHDLLAAGHPRLNFELTAFLANLAPHWNLVGPTDRSERDNRLRAWTTGQLVSAQAALELLAYRSEAAAEQNGAWPEFAEYDCFSCHHGLRAPSWRQVSPGGAGRTPGRWSWGSWYYPMLSVLPEGRREDQRALSSLKKLMEQSSLRPRAAGLEAQKSIAMLRQWEERLGRRKPDADMMRESRDRLGRDGRSAAPASWDLAEQLLLAANALQTPRVDHGQKMPALHDRQLRADIHDLLRALAFPQGSESPLEFVWDRSFDERLQDVLLRLGAADQ